MKIRILLMIAAAGLLVGCKCVVCDSYDYTSSLLPNDSSTAMHGNRTKILPDRSGAAAMEASASPQMLVADVS